MTTRIDQRFATLKAEGRAALVTFITAGDPDYATSLAIAQALPGAGADVIELGMPFTDPMADGPAIQAANLQEDLGIDAEHEPEDAGTLVEHLDGYLCEVKDVQIKDGLHVLGLCPEGEHLRGLVATAGQHGQRSARPYCGRGLPRWHHASKADADRRRRDRRRRTDNRDTAELAARHPAACRPRRGGAAVGGP